MIHRKKGRKLKRTASHRKALMSNLSASLILNKRIETTEAKAKELRRYIEPLITKARTALRYKDSSPEKSIHLRREARKFLQNKEALIILFDEISHKVGDRPGGFTRVLKKGFRFGDGAKTAIIEFVDYNYIEKKEAELKEKEDKKGTGKKSGKETGNEKDSEKTESKSTKTKSSKSKKTAAVKTKKKTEESN
ncbi:MAG: 50S ribosomal protein L17 [Ignavibacteria bacterium]|nr:50S ribosomal protein L17 [Ignavibacteria bacterium]